MWSLILQPLSCYMIGPERTVSLILMRNLCQISGFKPGEACLEKSAPIGGSISLIQGF